MNMSTPYPNEEEGRGPFGYLLKGGSHCGMAGETIGERAHNNGHRHGCGETGKNENRLNLSDLD